MYAGGDNCQYCHTRTEQQFYPEVYKSMKCNDLLEYGFCPRGIFCAFLHNEIEKYPLRDAYMREELGLENGGFPPDLNDPNQRVLYLEESLRNMSECAQMWKARFAAVTVKNSRIMKFLNSMGPINTEPRPLSISIPQEEGIHPLASLAHSPDFDIFAQQDSDNPPACMRCGRDPTSPIPDGPKKCPLCCSV
ncbi:hypothetical protein B9Z55_027958 [Caenorhabditis nigoni]|nr:hypothetical protein B9Z55_027958 [Caenorhabditis nigoni]